MFNVFPKYYRYIIVLLILCTSAINYLSMQSLHEWGGDFVHYIAQANSLINHNSKYFKESYQFIFNESTPKPGPIYAPWGLPIILTPLIFLKVNSIIIFKIVTYSFYVLALIPFYYLLRKYLSPYFSLVIIFFFITHPSIVAFKEIVQPDTMNFFFQLLGLYCIHLFFFQKEVRKNIFFQILFGIVLYFSFMVKTIGFVLTATLGLGYLLEIIDQRKFNIYIIKSKLIDIIPFAIFGLGYVLERLFLPSSHSTYSFVYENGILDSIIDNSKTYILNFILFVGFDNIEVKLLLITSTLIFCIFCMFFIYSIIVSFNRLRVLIIYLILFFAVLIPLPFNGGGFRYLLPVFAVFILIVSYGIARFYSSFIENKLSSQFNFLARLLIGLLIMVFLAVRYTKISLPYLQKKVDIEGPYSKDSQELFQFIIKGTSEDDVIVFFKPRVMNYFTKRNSFRMATSHNILDQNIKRSLENKKWDYFVEQNSYQMLSTNTNNLYPIVYKDRQFTVYKNYNINRSD